MTSVQTPPEEHALERLASRKSGQEEDITTARSYDDEDRAPELQQSTSSSFSVAASRPASPLVEASSLPRKNGQL